MTNEEMMDLLVKLTDTEFWPAIQRWTRNKDNDILSSLASIDPFKNPTELSRIQGMRMGIYGLERESTSEAEKRRKLEEAVKKAEEPDDTPFGTGLESK